MEISEKDLQYLNLVQKTPFCERLSKQLRNEGFLPKNEHEIRAGSRYHKCRRMYSNLVRGLPDFDTDRWDKLQKVFHSSDNTVAFDLLQKYFEPDSIDSQSSQTEFGFIRDFEIAEDDLTKPFRHSACKQALFRSARNGNPKQLECVLKSVATILYDGGVDSDKNNRYQKFSKFLLNTLDKIGKSLLHAAVDGNCVRCIEIVLEYAQKAGVKSKMLNAQTIFEETGLHIAIKKGYLPVIRKLLIEGANIFIRNRIGHYPLQQIYQLHPNFATFLLDTSISVTGVICENAVSLNIDLSIFTNSLLSFNINSKNWMPRVTDVATETTQHRATPTSSLSSSSGKSKHVAVELQKLNPPPKPLQIAQHVDQCNPEMYILAQLVYLKPKDCKSIMEHPVTHIFVDCKWKILKSRLLFLKTYLPLFMYSIYFYIIHDFYANPPIPSKNKPEENIILWNFSQTSSILTMILTTIFVLLLGTNVSLQLLHGHVVNKLCHKVETTTWKNHAFRILSNMAFPMVSITTIILPLIQSKEVMMYGNSVAVIGLLLAAFLTLRVIADSNLNKWMRSIYIHVYYKVMIRFLTVISTFFPLLLAFVIAFQVIFAQTVEFAGFWRTFFRLVIMLQGEFDYEDKTNFTNDGNAITETQVWCGRLLFAVLSCFLAIVLIDVFLGYTISDIEKLKRQAKFLRMCNQIKQIYFTEKCLELVRKTRLGKLKALQPLISLESINLIKSKKKLQFRNELAVNWTMLGTSKDDKLQQIIF